MRNAFFKKKKKRVIHLREIVASSKQKSLLTVTNNRVERTFMSKTLLFYSGKTRVDTIVQHTSTSRAHQLRVAISRVLRLNKLSFPRAVFCPPFVRATGPVNNDCDKTMIYDARILFERTKCRNGVKHKIIDKHKKKTHTHTRFLIIYQLSFNIRILLF